MLITRADPALPLGRLRVPGELAEELEVLRLLSRRLFRREIAAHLYVSINKVKTHQRAVFRKLEVAERASAAARARELGVL
jgi:LuxR family maltose regulon positive regulatory protein